MKIPKWLAKINSITALCDNCNYKEKINLNDFNIENIDILLNKKCPKCGHNMINENDLKKMRMILKSFHIDENENTKPNVTYRTKKH
jgi:Zn ribbon nucleic-acid-binding protein